MPLREHFIYVSGSINENHFGIDLPSTLHLEGEWKCAVVDCSFKFFNKELNKLPRAVFLLANFCTTSLVNDRHLPVLRKILLPKKALINFNPSIRLYIPIKQVWINRLEFSLTDINLDCLNLNPNSLIEFTLHLKKS